MQLVKKTYDFEKMIAINALENLRLAEINIIRSTHCKVSPSDEFAFQLDNCFAPFG